MTVNQGDLVQVAVYIDFDNIVMSRYDELHGRQAFRDDNAGKRNPEGFIRQRLAEARVDISAIMDFASSFGSVSISRSYADWSSAVNASYAEDLLRSSVDLVQMFPVTGSKNGADIRLAIDVMDDLARFPYVSHVLIVAGDSDYMSLAQRCRRLGRSVIGVGAAKSVGRYFKASCDEFRFYGNLPGVIDARAEAPVTVTHNLSSDSDTSTLIVRAAQLLAAKGADEWLDIGGLKAQMLRLDPTFDETAMGFRGFTHFLRARPEMVETRWPDGVPGGQVRLTDKYASATGELQDHILIDERGATPAHQQSSQVIDIWKALGLLSGTGGPYWERECLSVVRTAWRMVTQSETTSYARPPAKEVLATLGGDEPSPSLRRAVHVVFGLLPWFGRDEDNKLQPNPEFVEDSDDELLALLRQSIASRAQHKLYPRPVSAHEIASAIFETEKAEPEAIDAYERALRLPTVQQMSGTLGSQLLAAPVLWDVACATVGMPGNIALSSVEELADALTDPLLELERDPNTVRMDQAYTLLTNARVLTTDGDSVRSLHNRFEGAEAADVVACVVRQWATRLQEAGQSQPNEPMWLESFYRLALPDRSRIAWRSWVRSLLNS